MLASENPIRKVKFKKGLYKFESLFSLHKPESGDREVLLTGGDWWTEPHFYELEGSAPSGYVRVTGADFNTYSIIRNTKHYLPETSERVYIRNRYYKRGETLPTYPDKELKQQLMMDPTAVWHEGGYGDGYDGYFSFPGKRNNRGAIGLVKKSSIITDTTNTIE